MFLPLPQLVTSNKYKWIDVNRFLGLGKRPVPVPAAWQSDEGASLILNFEAQNLEGFQTQQVPNLCGIAQENPIVLIAPASGAPLPFRYQAPYAPRKCWPILDTQDQVTFDDSRYTENWYGTALVAKYAKAPAGCVEN